MSQHSQIRPLRQDEEEAEKRRRKGEMITSLLFAFMKHKKLFKYTSYMDPVQNLSLFSFLQTFFILSPAVRCRLNQFQPLRGGGHSHVIFFTVSWWGGKGGVWAADTQESSG